MKDRSRVPLVSILLALAATLQGCTAGPAADAVPASPAAAATPAGAGNYLTIEPGTLPLVLSVPHGGDLPLRDAPERAKGTKVKDDRVNELAAAIQRQLLARTGRQAYLVGANISRKYVDFNRKAEDAYEAPTAAPIYDAYYGALRTAIDAVRNQPGALLIDIHGQSMNKGAIFRGTGSGLTARNAPFYGQPDGLITRLDAGGLNVLPKAADAQETHFSGGTIVRVFGYQTPQGIDSVQLEFGANWRASPERIEQTAAVVADALLAHLRAAGYR
jgi:N-formylglutamate amidohydrolase